MAGIGRGPAPYLYSRTAPGMSGTIPPPVPQPGPVHGPTRGPRRQQTRQQTLSSRLQGSRGAHTKPLEVGTMPSDEPALTPSDPREGEGTLQGGAAASVDGRGRAAAERAAVPVGAVPVGGGATSREVPVSGTGPSTVGTPGPGWAGEAPPPGPATEGEGTAASASDQAATASAPAGASPSPWSAIELPPTATSRRRRKRGHRGGVGRRGGRRVAQPNPEDDPLYPFKVQAAKELGLWPKVEAEGWGALTSLESGRIGGYMQRLVKEAQEEGRIPPEVLQRLAQQRRIRPASTET